MDQTIINWLVAGFGGLLGFLLKAVWDAVKDLQTADKDLAEKVKAIEVLVAGKYVSREELSSTIDRIMAQLDRIEQRLSSKVDK